MRNESLEAVNQVTHLDLRDNCLDVLDLSSVCNLEILHGQRNQLGTLTLSGFTLRTLNASSNRESDKDLTSCNYSQLSACLCVYNLPQWYIYPWSTHINWLNDLTLTVVVICLQASRQSTSIRSPTSWHTWTYHSELWLGMRRDYGPVVT